MPEDFATEQFSGGIITCSFEEAGRPINDDYGRAGIEATHTDYPGFIGVAAYWTDKGKNEQLAIAELLRHIKVYEEERAEAMERYAEESLNAG
jgi:hypothetical protein